VDRHSPAQNGSDAALVERLRLGEPAAFDEVYERYRAGLFAFLVRACRERALAEELLQETWLSFARHARSLAADTNLRAWLFTVARNLWRSRRRRDFFGRELLRELGLVTGGANLPSPFEQVLANETQRRLEAAVWALPASAREVVLLVVIERLEPAEAAQVLGLRPEAVRQRLARARAMLAKLIAPAQGSRDPVGEAP
jgi:RNA polymerase sigma-70 factor (ECF subfamily)